jgi:hypothetical protein
VGLLKNSPSWTDADQKGMEQWFREFLTWLRTSKNGRDEAKAENNHGTFYDVQIVDFALFTGQRELAARTLNEAKKNRIESQVEPDGRQPRETDRTKGLSYSVMNLEGLFDLAQLGEHAGVDLWVFESKGGRSVRKALDWLVPYVSGGKKWTYEQIEPYQPFDFVCLLLRAAPHYGPRYRELADKLDRGDEFETRLLRAAMTTQSGSK